MVRWDTLKVGHLWVLKEIKDYSEKKRLLEFDLLTNNGAKYFNVDILKDIFEQWT